MNAIKSIAASTRFVCATAVFSVMPYGSAGKLDAQPDKPHTPCCDSIYFGAIHTTKQAGNPPDSGIFSRPEFNDVHFCTSHGFGAGSAYPQGRQHNLFCVDIPSSTLWPIQSDGGFQFNKERETMTNVITLARARAANTVQSTTSSPDTCRQQAAIENALSMALYYMRQPRTDSALHAATAKTNRALTLLKTACTDSQIGGSV